jgi:hypothetical protein
MLSIPLGWFGYWFDAVQIREVNERALRDVAFRSNR